MYTQEETTEALNEAKEISKELDAKLSNVRIKLDKVKNADVINAIRLIFGTEYISDYGNVYITYQMYSTCIRLIRELGKIIGDNSV